MPTPDKLPADFDFSKQGPPDKLPANFEFGDSQSNQPEKAGYLQELWKQADLPGIVKSLKEHPAETVANAIGGLFAPLNPNFTQSPQGQAMKENLTRSPQSAAAALTLGGLAMAPAAAGPIAEGLANAGKYVGAATKAGAPGVIGGLAKAGIGEVLAKVPGMELPARFGLQYPAMRQVAKAIEKGHEAGVAAVKPAAEAATEAVPAAVEPTLAGGTTVQDIGKGLGIKNWKNATAEQRAGAQKVFDQLKAQENGQGSPATAAPSAAPRPPEYYGVKPAQTPPVPPANNPPVPSPEPEVSAAPPAPAKVQSIRVEPPPTPPQPTPAESLAKTAGAKSVQAQAKADRFVTAIQQFNRAFPDKALTADELEVATDTDKSLLTRGLQQAGYLKNTEKFSDTSFPFILDKLRAAEAARQTIRPPAGFSMGNMRQ